MISIICISHTHSSRTPTYVVHLSMTTFTSKTESLIILDLQLRGNFLPLFLCKLIVIQLTMIQCVDYRVQRNEVVLSSSVAAQFMELFLVFFCEVWFVGNSGKFIHSSIPYLRVWCELGVCFQVLFHA